MEGWLLFQYLQIVFSYVQLSYASTCTSIYREK